MLGNSTHAFKSKGTLADFHFAFKIAASLTTLSLLNDKADDGNISYICRSSNSCTRIPVVVAPILVVLSVFQPLHQSQS